MTRGYHLLAMPGNRTRVAVDWVLDAVFGRPAAQMGLVRGEAVPLATRTPQSQQQPETSAG